MLKSLDMAIDMKNLFSTNIKIESEIDSNKVSISTVNNYEVTINGDIVTYGGNLTFDNILLSNVRVAFFKS